MDFFYLGLMFIGGILSIKVFTEGKTHLGNLKSKLETYQVTTQKCLEKTQEQDQKTHEVQAINEKLTLELNALKSKRNHMRNKTRDLKSKLGQSYKLQ